MGEPEPQSEGEDSTGTACLQDASLSMTQGKHSAVYTQGVCFEVLMPIGNGGVPELGALSSEAGIKGSDSHQIMLHTPDTSSHVPYGT